MSCPCGLGESIDTCCGPYLSGAQLPETAEQLMRSRYTAFATGQTQYILDTCHPEMAEKPEAKDIEQWSKGSTWLGFELRSTDRGQATDQVGTVEFVAKYRAGAQTIHHREVSEFKKVEGRWFFVEGQELPQEPIKNDLKNVGRNDPCPCGSGKKFKKCCWGTL